MELQILHGEHFHAVVESDYKETSIISSLKKIL